MCEMSSLMAEERLDNPGEEKAQRQGRCQGSLWGHPTLSVIFCTPLPDQPFQGRFSQCSAHTLLSALTASAI